MIEDKELAIKFFKSINIESRYFPKKIEGKNPDFELHMKHCLFGYCELKSIIDYDVCGERPNPTFNKIQNKIHEAAKQLNNVSPEHTVPNIVFFINHTKKVGWQDLWHVLTGQVTPPNQPTEPIDLRYFNRLLKKGDHEAIDYFIWADTFKNNIYFSINSASPFSDDLKATISSKAYEKINITDI